MSNHDAIPDDDEYIGHGRANKLSGFGAGRLLRLVVLGDIRAKVEPGRAIQYRWGDIRRAMQGKRQTA